MKIAVMGSGGVGGYFGGILARAGNAVTFIARGEHLRAIRKEGLRVVHNAGEFTVDASATDNAEGVGPVELVLFSVKAYDTDSALQIMSPLMGPDTTVLTLQNGVDSHAAVAKAFGENTRAAGGGLRGEPHRLPRGGGADGRSSKAGIRRSVGSGDGSGEEGAGLRYFRRA